MIVSEIYVPEKKPRGGAKPGAGRPREKETPFSQWADSRGYKTKDISQLLGVSRSTAIRLLGETMRPGLELATKIEELTRTSDGVSTFPAAYWLKVPKNSAS
jgi:hypothetical protein